MSDQKFSVYITERTLNCWSHGNQMNCNWWLLSSHQKAQSVIFFTFASISSGTFACLCRPLLVWFYLLNEPASVFWLLVSEVFCRLCLRTVPGWLCYFKVPVGKPEHLILRHIWQNWPEPGLSVHEPASPWRGSRSRNHSPSPSLSSPPPLPLNTLGTN